MGPSNGNHDSHPNGNEVFYELENHWHDPWSFGILGGSGFAAAGSGRSDVAERNYKTAMAEQSLGLEKTDPELEAMMKGYIYGDIMEQARLTRREQHLVTIATLTASGAQDLLEKNVRGALTDGVTPLDVREAILPSGALYWLS